MSNPKPTLRCVFALLLIGFVAPIVGAYISTSAQQPSLGQLEAKLQEQYAAIGKQFENGPSRLLFPPDPRERLRLWQAELARRFAQAGATVEEILKLHPPQEEMWRERSETLWVYAQPVSPPERRTVFGSSEVEKHARFLEAPLAAYPDEARAAKAKGEVRLRLVLTADGSETRLPDEIVEARFDGGSNGSGPANQV